MPVTGPIFIPSPLESMKPSGRHHLQGAEPQNKVHMADVCEQNVNIKFWNLSFFSSLFPSSCSTAPHLICVCPFLFWGICFVMFVCFFILYEKYCVNLTELDVTAAACHVSFQILGLSQVPNKYCIIFELAILLTSSPDLSWNPENRNALVSALVGNMSEKKSFKCFVCVILIVSASLNKV